MLSNLVLGGRGMKLLNPSLLNRISLMNLHRSLKLLPLVLSRRSQLLLQLAAPVHLLLLLEAVPSVQLVLSGARMLHSANRQELGHLLVLSQILVHLKLPLNLLNPPWLSVVPDAR